MSLGNPRSVELIAAVNEFLEKEVMPQLDARTAFHMKVTTNVLNIVSRELAQGNDFNETTTELITSFLKLPSTNDDLEASYLALCQHIENTDTALDDPSLLSMLKQITLKRLAIDNPKYSGYQYATEK